MCAHPGLLIHQSGTQNGEYMNATTTANAVPTVDAVRAYLGPEVSNKKCRAILGMVRASYYRASEILADADADTTDADASKLPGRAALAMAATAIEFADEPTVKFTVVADRRHIVALLVEGVDFRPFKFAVGASRIDCRNIRSRVARERARSAVRCYLASEGWAHATYFGALNAARQFVGLVPAVTQVKYVLDRC